MNKISQNFKFRVVNLKLETLNFRDSQVLSKVLKFLRERNPLT